MGGKREYRRGGSETCAAYPVPSPSLWLAPGEKQTGYCGAPLWRERGGGGEGEWGSVRVVKCVMYVHV